MQRLIVAPIMELVGTSTRIRGARRRLVPPLLHIGTVDWFLAGLALIAAGLWFDGPARVVVGLLAACMYSFAAGANAWATRGRHPGWMLLAAAVGLIVASFRV